MIEKKEYKFSYLGLRSNIVVYGEKGGKQFFGRHFDASQQQNKNYKENLLQNAA